MPPVIGFLHTAEVHVATFARLVRQERPDARDHHLVDAGLLERARADGPDAVHDDLLGRLQELAALAVDVVVCTCSTIGGLAEALADEAGVRVLRVDRPMAEEAVAAERATGRPVLVVAALTSTLRPTRALLNDVAHGRPVAVVELVVDDAWPLFEAGDLSGYLTCLADAVRPAAAREAPSVVLLAQASAAGAADLLAGLGVPVLSSPGRAVAALAGY